MEYILGVCENVASFIFAINDNTVPCITTAK